MPNIPDCQKWINDTKKYLGLTVGETDLQKRNEEIAKLLQDPALVKSNIYKDEYENIANRARKISQGGSGKNKKEDVQQIEAELRLLKKKVRLEAGKNDPTANAKVQSETLKAQRNEPFYRDKRERVLKTLESIEKLPGAVEEAAVLKKLLDAATACEPDYRLALMKLTFLTDLTVREGEGLRLHLEDAHKTSQKFTATAGGPAFQNKLAAARKAVDDYDKVAGTTDGSGVATARASITAAVKLLEGKTPDEKKATAELDKIISGYGAIASEFGKIKGELEKIMPGVKEKVRKLAEYSPAEASAELRTRYQVAWALFENQKLKAAKEAWTSLQTDIDVALPPYEQAYNQWQKVSQDIADNRGILVEALKKPALQTAANYLESLIERRIGADLLAANKFGEACQLAAQEDLVGSLIELQKRLAFGNPRFKNPELNGITNVIKHRQTIDKKLLEASAELEKLAQAKGDTSPFEATKKELISAWLDMSTMAKLDDTALDTLAQDAVQEADKLKVKITAVLNDPTALDKSKQVEGRKAEAAKFEAARGEAQKAMQELALYNLPDGSARMKEGPNIVDLRKDYQTMVDEMQDGKYPLAKMERISSACENKMKLIESDLNEMRKKAALDAGTIRKNVATAEQTNGQYKNFYAAIREQVDDLLGLTGSSVLSQVNKGADELKALAAAKLPDAADFQKVEQGLRKLSTMVSGDDLKAYQPEAQAVLEKRLKEELKNSVYQLSPAEALKSIADFEAEVDTAGKRAVVLKNLRVKVQNRAKTAKKTIKQLKKGAPTLYASLKKRLEAAAKCPADGVDHANLEVSSIEILLNSAKDPSAKGKFSAAKLKKLNKKAELDEFEGKRQKASFESSQAVFKYGVQIDAQNMYESIPRAQVNKDVYDQIAKSYDLATSLASKSNYAGANEELLRAMNLARYFINNPTDGATAARKELGRLNQEYKTAVSEYLKELTELETEVKSAQEDDGTAINTASAVKTLQPLYSLFNAAAFDAEIDKLSKPPATVQVLNEQRQYQDVALRTIRLAEKVVDSNPVLKHVISNPIKPVSVAKLKTSLRMLKAAMLAS